MKPWSAPTNVLTIVGIVMGSSACGARSSFDFGLQDSSGVLQVTSDATATGSVNNAGLVTLGDTEWGLVMDLQGLSAGSHPISMGSGELQIIHKNTVDTYKASLGGTCSVWVDPHGATNGSVVSGTFNCAGLTSTTGTTVTVTNGDFQVPIDDPANNPK